MALAQCTVCDPVHINRMRNDSQTLPASFRFSPFSWSNFVTDRRLHLAETPFRIRVTRSTLRLMWIRLKLFPVMDGRAEATEWRKKNYLRNQCKGKRDDEEDDNGRTHFSTSHFSQSALLLCEIIQMPFVLCRLLETLLTDVTFTVYPIRFSRTTENIVPLLSRLRYHWWTPNTECVVFRKLNEFTCFLQ